MKLVMHWFISALAILISAYLLPGIMISGFFVAFVTAIVLGFVNVFLRPLLILLTLPITILSMGLFALVVNALLIMLTGAIVPGFYVDGFFSALLFSIILFLLIIFWDIKIVENILIIKPAHLQLILIESL